MHGPTQIAPDKLDRFNRSSFGTLSIYAVEVLARLNETIDAVEKAYHDYEFNTVAQRLYDFIWSDYCDWFVEAAKTDIFSEDESKKKSALAVMDYVLSAIVRLLHPFMPHITEELWSLLGLGKDSIQFAPLPKKITLKGINLPTKRRAAARVYDVVQKARNLRVEAGTPSNKKIRVFIDSTDKAVSSQLETIARLTNAEAVVIRKSMCKRTDESRAALYSWYSSTGWRPSEQYGYSGYSGYSGAGMVTVQSAGVDKSAERERLDKEIAKVEEELRTVETKLSNKSFVDRAPKAVVEEHRQRRANFAEQVRKLKEARDKLD